MSAPTMPASATLLLAIVLVAGLFLVGCQSELRPNSSAPVASRLSPSAVDDSSRSASSKPAATRPTFQAVKTLANSVLGSPIELVSFPSAQADAPNVLLFAGIHGDEPTTVGVMKRLLQDLHTGKSIVDVNLFIIPLANPDGYAIRTRVNANKVDLNRNFPAKNWKTSMRKTQYWNGPSPLSEPESKALHDLVLELKPVRILSLHSIRAGRHGNNFDGPAADLAALLSSKNGYNVLPTMGYPTPGSFGSWAGIDLGIPTITLELPSNVPAEQAWEQNREALWAFIRGK